MSSPLVHVSVSDGHHRSYQDLFVALLGGHRSTGHIFGNSFWRLIFARRVLFATLDADYFGFATVSVLRFLQGRPTVGIFIRCMQCFSPNKPTLYRIKYFFFVFLCAIPGLRVISILPHSLHPLLGRVSHDWIFDPQMWDLWVDGVPSLPETPLSRFIASKKAGRRTIIYIGKANNIKEFPLLAEMLLSGYLSRYFVVIAGEVSSEYLTIAESLRSHGVLIEDRRISDDEVLSLYGIADYAWCYYSTFYDQSSGIFGRAYQTGVAPIIRPGSVIDRIHGLVSDVHPAHILIRDVSVLRDSLA